MVIGKAIKFFGQRNLRARVARGGLWLGGATALDQGARFLRNVILARILAPADFGLMATVSATTIAFDAFMEVGVRQCVIQSTRGTEEDFLNAAWWFSAARGAMLCAAGVLAAPLVSYVYKSDAFTPLLRVAFVVLLLQGIISPRMHMLEKGLQFSKWVIVTQGSGLASVVISITAAVFLRNVWALVIGIVSEASLRVLLSHILCGFRPRWPVDREAFREISGFARGMFGLPILMMLFSQGPILYLRWAYADSEVGKYKLASDLAALPLFVFNGAILPLMLPTFSRFKEDPERLRRAVLDAVKSVIMLAAPVAGFLVVFAGPLARIAYGERYADTGTVLSLLAVGALVTMINACVVTVFLALGMPALHRRYSFVRVVILAAAIAPLVKWQGVAGAPIALLTALVAVFVVQQNRLDKLIGIRGKDVVLTAAQGLFAGLFATVCFVIAKVLLAEGISFEAGGRTMTIDGAYVSVAIGAVIMAAAVVVGASKIIGIRGQAE